MHQTQIYQIQCVLNKNCSFFAKRIWREMVDLPGSQGFTEPTGGVRVVGGAGWECPLVLLGWLLVRARGLWHVGTSVERPELLVSTLLPELLIARLLSGLLIAALLGTTLWWWSAMWT